VGVVPFGTEAADRFGRLSAALASKGTPIGTLDTMIAAHALALGVTLVTHSRKHFGRVRGLRLADWV
jgi:tRNA(fMet)-specific endonuclease VapC